MSDASTNQSTADVQEPTGHGKHRGPVSLSWTETGPRCKSVEQTEAAA